MPPFAKPLTSQQVQQTVRETYTLHFLFQNLGFESDHIFVGCLNLANLKPPGVHACVKLVAQGLEFVYWIARVCPADERRFERAWTEFARNQPTMSRDVLDRIVVGSQVYAHAEVIVKKLLEKGFSIPEELSGKWIAIEAHRGERPAEFSPSIAMALSPEVPDGSSN